MAQVSSGDLRHRSRLSLDTNASGIAGSTMSMGGESLRLSQFPHPPTEIPTTPIQSEFGGSTPTRSVSSAPTTPRSRHFPKFSAKFSPRKTSMKKPAPPPEKVDPAPMQPPVDTSYPPPPAIPNLRTPNRGLVDSTVIPSHVFASSRSLSPHDWHEGASSIDVDTTEEQLLPTSFITALLSSTEFNRDGQRLRNTRLEGSRLHNNISSSDVSELSHRPVDRSANSRMRGHPHSLATTSHSAAPPVAFQTRSYFPRGLPSADRAESLLSDRMSSDSVTLHSMTDNNSAFAVYGFAPEKKLGHHGGSIISDAPTSLRDLRSRSPESSTRGLLPNQNASGRAVNSDQDFDVDEQFIKGSSAMFSPAFPSTAGSQTHFREEGLVRRETRQSSHSAKTTRSFFSVVSSAAAKPAALVKGVLGWRAVKPLPPIPRVPNISLAAEMEHRRQEESMPTSQLASRANTLAHLLEKDNFSYHTLDSSVRDRRDPNLRQATQSHIEPDQGQGVQLFFPRELIPQRGKAAEPFPSRNVARLGRRKTKRRALAIVLLVAVVIAIGIGVGVTRKRRSSQPSCPGSTAGALCNLNATCICTATQPGQCGGLSQNLLSLLPSVNSLFNMNISSASLSASIWQMQGAPTGINCAPQAVLVDVSPALDPAKSPNRTEWAQSALLWTLVQSQNLSAVAQLRDSVRNAPWSSLLPIDGPTSDPSAKFQVLNSGFIFDFATQSVTQPNVSFVTDGEPTSGQLSEVGNVAQAALDRMYSYAHASSTQREDALAIFWRGVLRQDPRDLPMFMAAVSSSPMLVPFDATIADVAGLLTNSTTVPFPPPLGCYPALNASQIALVNTLENSVFGLPSTPANTGSQFNTSCFPDRPLYGVLDILQLRLPFLDSQTGVAKQAAVLQRTVAPRAVVYNGELLSPLPDASGPSLLTQSQADPRQYGTLNHLNHVMLNYLSSISDINVATAIVEYVLSSPAVPPSNTTFLFQSLTSIPTLELAIFGSITPPDISSSVSSFTTPAGSLFFGSDQAAALRDWALTGTNSSVTWTEFATSSEVVHDTSLTNAAFNSVWQPASTYLHSRTPNTVVNVGNITNAFQVVGLFSP